MCSESVPWKRHRLIISNTLTLKSLTIQHIMTDKKMILQNIGMHGKKTVVEGSTLIYPKQLGESTKKDEGNRK
ncbi:hypothetical protein [Carnobacterium funditum]|uniref:hypothetical protein n=1 Tax=Carnobacterium funditum TaxID=2752 RepID=UPI000A4E46E1|nr:hypothetical protein [Carnobacterium funditum]